MLKFAASMFHEKRRPLPQDEALSVNSRQCWNHWLLLTLGDALSEGKDSRSPPEVGSEELVVFLDWKDLSTFLHF